MANVTRSDMNDQQGQGQGLRARPGEQAITPPGDAAGGGQPIPAGGPGQRTDSPGTQAYGDFGHPGSGRQAYGDMGMEHDATGGGRADRARTRQGPTAYPRANSGGRGWRTTPMRAGDVMTRHPRTAKTTDTIQHVAQMMVDEDCGIVPVVEGNGRLVGVVTDRDIVCRVVAPGTDTRSARVGDVMTDRVECATEQDSLHDVLHLMSEHQVRRIPVVGPDDRLVGVVSMADIAREADVDPALQDTFATISSERGFWSRLR